MGELLLGQPNGGGSLEVVKFLIFFSTINYFGTSITGHSIEGGAKKMPA